jgi:hypothetical protein
MENQLNDGDNEHKMGANCLTERQRSLSKASFLITSLQWRKVLDGGPV